MTVDGRCNFCGAAVSVATDRLWRKDGLDIVRCTGCGLVFRASPPTAPGVAAIYGDDYFSSSAGDTRGQGYADYLGEEDAHRLNARARLDRLAQAGFRGGKLLDVGCAAGFFADEARRGGFEVAGIEVSATMARCARERFGLDVWQGAFLDAPLAEGSFDVVTMWDYIEHSIDAAGDLSRAAALLRSGGLLALSTGDAASPVARLSGRRWHLLTPRHHNYFFTEPTLRAYLAQVGLEAISVSRPPSLYSVTYLAYKLRTLADVALLRAAADFLAGSRLGQARVRVNLWDIMTVIARKP